MAKTAKPGMKGQGVDSYGLFAEYFRLRPDVGFDKMLLDVALHPRDPFKPWEPRKVKKGFIATALLLLIALAWYSYFSLPQQLP